MSVFTVSTGEAASFQEHYQRLVETWLRALLDKERQKSPLREPEKLEIRVTDGNRVVYGQVGKKFRNELTPELIEQIEELRATPVGGVVCSSGAKTIEVDGQVVLQSDLEGKVIVNSLGSIREIEGLSSETEMKVENSSQFLSDESVNFYDEDGKPVPPEEASASVSNELEFTSQTNTQEREQKQTDRESGLEKVRSSVEEIPDSSLKQMLFSQLNEMRSELQRQQQHRQALEELVTERLAQPQSASWWQQLKGAITQTWQSLRELSREHSAAATLKTLFQNQVPPGGQVYQADNYTLQREGRAYTLMDKSGTRLMQFQSTPMGVRVNRESVQLQVNHYQDINQLSAMQTRGEELSGAFAPTGALETAYLARVKAITKALSQYAQATGSKVQVDGKFAYKWLATPDGRVRIDAKDGRGSLLVQAQGQLRCGMSDRDLAHFEQMLPVLKSARSRSRTVDWERN
jgi:hypothetical protein